MPKLSLEKLLSNQKNLERILDNLKDGIIAHDLKPAHFLFYTGKQRKLPVTAERKFLERSAIKRLACLSVVGTVIF